MEKINGGKIEKYIHKEFACTKSIRNKHNRIDQKLCDQKGPYSYNINKEKVTEEVFRVELCKREGVKCSKKIIKDLQTEADKMGIKRKEPCESSYIYRNEIDDSSEFESKNSSDESGSDT
ncbi:MAG: hypothetical protein LBR91_03675 [Puniceicoccales bacterium]|jgi:hypothetical protein|nr:hypothetical protein [Puniceicoccales bacterium]